MRTPAVGLGATTMPMPAAAGVTQQNNGQSPAALTLNNTQWFEADQSLLEQKINGPVVQRLWSIRNRTCGTFLLEQGCDQGDTMS